MQVSSVDRSPNWRPQGADLYSTGASGAVPVRPVHAVNAVESIDRLGEGVVLRTSQSSDTSKDPEVANRDWTMTDAQKKAEVDKPEKTEEPPKEPLYKQMLEYIQSMWRASAQVVEMAEKINKTTPEDPTIKPVRDEPVTYADPKVKRTGKD
jgi:hypothetical protein